MVLGYFFVRPIPLPPAEEHGREHVHTVANRGDEEGRRLLNAEGDSEGDSDGDDDDDRIEDPDAL